MRSSGKTYKFIGWSNICKFYIIKSSRRSVNRNYFLTFNTCNITSCFPSIILLIEYNFIIISIIKTASNNTNTFNITCWCWSNINYLLFYIIRIKNVIITTSRIVYIIRCGDSFPILGFKIIIYVIWCIFKIKIIFFIMISISN